MHKTTLLMTALVAAALLVPSSPADAATPKCQGKRATIVGKPNKSIDGTKGNDVIVTNGAFSAAGHEGNDLVCVTKTKSDVSGGPGDDTVVVLVKDTFMRTSLGEGDDRYTGSDGGEDVVDPGRGKDVIRTYGGKDSVYLGSAELQATVDLGAGDDVVRISMYGAGSSHVDGGPGTNTLAVSAQDWSKVAVWRFDAVRGLATADGKRMLHWKNLQAYDLNYLGGKDLQIAFKGSAADEAVALGYSYGRGREVDLKLGGGDDEVTVSGADHGKVELGKGQDGFTVNRGTSADIDLLGESADVVQVDDGGTSHFSLGGVDDVTTLNILEVLIDGDDGDNKLRAEDVCQATLNGLGGDDKLVVMSDTCADDQSASVYGGPGDDYLQGGYRDDLLDGGDDTDEAIGLAGQDTCLAETTKYCELP